MRRAITALALASFCSPVSRPAALAAHAHITAAARPQVTLRKIDNWLREIRPDLDVDAPGPGSPPLGSGGGGPSVRVDSFDDDEDYAGETEEESD